MGLSRPLSPSLDKRDLKHWLSVCALGPSMLASAALMAISIGRPGLGWLAWLSLLPFLGAIRALTPLPATLTGAAWGIALFVASTSGLAPNIEPSLLALALLIVVPAAYAGLGALATRALGFVPAILALLWILAEVALQPLGLKCGLIAGTQGHGGLAVWLAGMFGYVLLASAVIYVNAWLVNLIVTLRIDIDLPTLLDILTARPSRLVPIAAVRPQLAAVYRGRPRAPPAR